MWEEVKRWWWWELEERHRLSWLAALAVVAVVDVAVLGDADSTFQLSNPSPDCTLLATSCLELHHTPSMVPPHNSADPHSSQFVSILLLLHFLLVFSLLLLVPLG